MRPLLVVGGITPVGSFFIINNLVPYANKIFPYDIRHRQMNQTLEFQDGLFFNGIDGMSIRVGHQNRKQGLTDVLIYDNRNASGNMTTTVAGSAISGSRTTSAFWRSRSSTANATNRPEMQVSGTTKVPFNAINSWLQKANISISGFEMQRTDADLFNNAQTKTSPNCNTKSTR